MSRMRLIIICLVAMLPSLYQAQVDENPTVAVLKFGPSLSDASLETAVIDTLLVYEWITAEEHARLNERQDIEGEKINIFWADANYDLTNVSLIVENALDPRAPICSSRCPRPSRKSH